MNKEEREKEKREILKRIAEVATVEDIFWWKNLSDKRFSVEILNKEKIEKLEWDDTDVLYSFLGIYLIGVLAYYPHNFHKTKYKIHNSANENMYSLERLTKQYDTFSDLNNNPQLKRFIKKYFSIGNIIPVWPGANENRGKSYMFDIPDIYFNKNELWTKILMEIYKNSYLGNVINGKVMYEGDVQYIINPPIYNFNSTPDFLESIANEKYSLDVRICLYSKWIERIVGIIQDREDNINKWLMERSYLTL